MLLNEISIPKFREDANRILVDAGYFKLGFGYFADVYKKPNANYVLKLFESNDKTYKKYVEFILKNKNIHFPKVIGKLIKINDNYYGVRLEELTPIDKNSVEINTLLFSCLCYFKKLGLVASSYVDHYYNKFGQIADYPDDYMKFMDNDLKEMCNIIYQFTIKSGKNLDIGYDNWMMRNNILIFVDPVI